MKARKLTLKVSRGASWDRLMRLKASSYRFLPHAVSGSGMATTAQFSIRAGDDVFEIVSKKRTVTAGYGRDGMLPADHWVHSSRSSFCPSGAGAGGLVCCR